MSGNRRVGTAFVEKMRACSDAGVGGLGSTHTSIFACSHFTHFTEYTTYKYYDYLRTKCYVLKINKYVITNSTTIQHFHQAGNASLKCKHCDVIEIVPRRIEYRIGFGMMGAGTVA